MQTDLVVKVLNTKRRGLRLAVVVLPEDIAIKLEELSHLKGRVTALTSRHDKLLGTT